MKNLLANNFAHHKRISKLSRIMHTIHYSNRLNVVGIGPIGYKITLITSTLNEKL